MLSNFAVFFGSNLPSAAFVRSGVVSSGFSVPSGVIVPSGVVVHLAFSSLLFSCHYSTHSKLTF